MLQRIDGIDIPTPFDHLAFARNVAVRRRRPIDVRPVPAPFLGAWLAFRTKDVILYASELTGQRRDRAIVRELSHMMCGHAASSTVPMKKLLPDLDADAVARVLDLKTASRIEELEAEVMTSLILARSERTGRE